MLQLLNNASATGAAQAWAGGKGAFIVPSGTFGGTSVELEFSIDGGAVYLTVDKGSETNVTFTAASWGLFELPSCLIRASVTGGTPSGLNAFASKINQ